MAAGGTATSATWSMQLVIPKYSESGAWTVSRIAQYDVFSRYYGWSTADLMSSGLNPYFQVNSSPSDVTKPAISDITISPGFVNTTLASQTVTVSLKVSDDLAGVIFEPTSVNASMIYGPQVYSPSQAQYAYVNPWASANSGGFKLVAGVTLNGTWQGTFTLPRYAEAGTWTIDSVRIRDRANNELYLTAAQLAAAGLQRTVVVTKPTGTADNVINPALGGTVVDDVYGTKAQVSVPPGVLTSETTVSIDVFKDPLGTPTPTGFSAPGTLFVNINMTPHPSGALPAPGLTVTVPVSGALTAGTVLTLYRVDTATGTLVAARNVSGGIVTGTVDAGGLTATFSGIAALSTVVGLIPSGVVVGDANLDGHVSCLDYAVIKQAIGKRRGQAGYLASADLNNDGVISLNDLMVVARLLTAGCPAN
jgi:hypothetical protein